MIKEREKFRMTPRFEQMETASILFTDEGILVKEKV